MNIIAKGAPDKPYILVDLIATPLTKSKFERLQQLNPELLGDYRYIPYSETDFSWWSRISQKLTGKKIRQAYFNCDFHGKVTEL